MRSAARSADQAERTAREVADSQPGHLFTRLGFATIGLVYLIMGTLAGRVALGRGGALTDPRGAVNAIDAQPAGRLALAVVALGLFGYVAWHLVSALADVERKGHSPRGLLSRGADGVVAVIYAEVGYVAARLALGWGASGKSSDQSAQDWTVTLLRAPFGRALVVLVGLVVLAVAIAHFYEAYTVEFRDELSLPEMLPPVERCVLCLGRAGMAARGVVFALIGPFFIVAGLRHNPQDAKGIGGVLAELLRQPFGPALLGVVAAGLVAYGLFSVAQARYHRVAGATSARSRW